MSLDGRTIKETQLGLFEVQHGELLERCRAAAIVYARRHGFVSINEVREAVTLPPGTHPSLLGAVFRTRSRMAYAIHRFFQERDFIYVHTPIITASDCAEASL